MFGGPGGRYGRTCVDDDEPHVGDVEQQGDDLERECRAGIAGTRYGAEQHRTHAEQGER